MLNKVKLRIRLIQVYYLVEIFLTTNQLGHWRLYLLYSFMCLFYQFLRIRIIIWVLRRSAPERWANLGPELDSIYKIIIWEILLFRKTRKPFVHQFCLLYFQTLVFYLRHYRSVLMFVKCRFRLKLLHDRFILPFCLNQRLPEGIVKNIICRLVKSVEFWQLLAHLNAAKLVLIQNIPQVVFIEKIVIWRTKRVMPF